MKILKWIGLKIVVSNFLRNLRFWAELHQERITWNEEKDAMTVNTREIKLLGEGLENIPECVWLQDLPT